MADPTPETLEPHNQASRHDPVYDRLHETAEFTELRRRYRGFVFPWTVAFLSWYLLYVVMSNWADDFSTAKLDPLARQLDEDYMKNRRGGENA